MIYPQLYWYNIINVVKDKLERELMLEYKAVLYQEGMLGSLLLGQSKIDPLKFTEFLNKNARQGWEVVTMEKDMRRMLLLWKREAYVVILKREKR